MTQLEQVEIEIETAKYMIQLKESLKLLRENKYFKQIIEEGYFTHEMNRVVMLKGADIDPAVEKSLDKMLIGIASLNNFFNEINRRGSDMEKALGEYETTREEILIEEVQ